VGFVGHGIIARKNFAVGDGRNFVRVVSRIASDLAAARAGFLSAAKEQRSVINGKLKLASYLPRMDSGETADPKGLSCTVSILFVRLSVLFRRRLLATPTCALLAKARETRSVTSMSTRGSSICDNNVQLAQHAKPRGGGMSSLIKPEKKDSESC
jgi:hypothetical protein